MAFEKRRSAGSYFYLSVRDPATGKVKKQYLGRGREATDAARALARRKRLREADLRAVRADQDSLRGIDRLTAELDAAAVLMMEAVLLAGGWHRENYGAWRRRRHDHGRHGPAPAGGVG